MLMSRGALPGVARLWTTAGALRCSFATWLDSGWRMRNRDFAAGSAGSGHHGHGHRAGGAVSCGLSRDPEDWEIGEALAECVLMNISHDALYQIRNLLVPSGFPKIPQKRQRTQAKHCGVGSFLNSLALHKHPATSPEDACPSSKSLSYAMASQQKPTKPLAASPRKYFVTNGDLLFFWSGKVAGQFWTGGKDALNQHLFK